MQTIPRASKACIIILHLMGFVDYYSLELLLQEIALAGIEVEPVLSFHSRLALVKDLPEGASISYGCEKILKRDSRVGVMLLDMVMQYLYIVVESNGTD